MSCIDRKSLWVLKYNYISIIYMSQRKKSQRTQKNKKSKISERLSTIKEMSSLKPPSPRRQKTKRKREGSNEDVFTALRTGYHLTRNKNRIFQRSLQPQLRLPRTNLLTREVNKHKPRYTFKGLGKPLGIKI